MHRSYLPSVLKAAGAGIGERQVKATISTASIDRMGDIVVQEGISTRTFEQSPTVLFNHDHMYPVAKAIRIGLEGGKLTAVAQFPPPGTSAKSDEVYGLIKSGVINSTSIGFMPIKAEPIDKNRPYGPQKFLTSELLEFSFVSVAANSQANITERDFDTAKPMLSRARERLAQLKRRPR